jgi:hypothetical protein
MGLWGKQCSPLRWSFAKESVQTLSSGFQMAAGEWARYGSGFQILDGFEWDSWCTHEFPTFAQSVPD